MDQGMTDVRERAYVDLCRTYDKLLEPEAPPQPERVRAELATFARVFDIEVGDADAAEIWRQLRPQISLQLGEGGERKASGGAAPKIFLPSMRDAGVALGGGQEPLSLLVVEDDPDLGPAMVEALMEAGHRVVAHAAAADVAANQAAIHEIDLAIVDVELAERSSGADLARLLHERWGIPALFISGGPNEHLLDQGHAVGFLGKPFKIAELLAAVTLATPMLRKLERV